MMKLLHIRSMALCLFTTLISAHLCYSGLKEDGRPNIIFILTDDQPYDYMGCVGNNLIQTPNLDQLADEGVLFTNFHVTSAICTPSRASIFLSQYERKHGVNFNSGTSVSENAWSFSYTSILRASGYYTGYVGKNHVPVGLCGYEDNVMEDSFDYWYGAQKHLGFYPKEKHPIFEGAISDTQVEILNEGVNDFLASNEYKLEGAVHFLNQRPKDQPFLLNISFNLPHDAGTGSMKQKADDPDIYQNLYRDLDIPLPENYIAKADIVEPKLPVEVLHAEDRQSSYDWVDTPEDYRERTIRKMQAMTGIDQLIGQLRNHLKDLNIAQNTVIIFTSDHGLFSGEFGLGGKALCYEKVTHVPLIIYNPNQDRSLNSKQNDALVQSVDLAPTILSLAGIKTPDSYQGFDISPLYTGDANKVRDFIYTENLWSTHFGNPRIEAVQNQKWKYIRYYQNNNMPFSEVVNNAKEIGLDLPKVLYGQTVSDMIRYKYYLNATLKGEEPVYEELYHLEEDPDETNNLIAKYAFSDELEKMRLAWRKELLYAYGDGMQDVRLYTNEVKDECNME